MGGWQKDANGSIRGGREKMMARVGPSSRVNQHDFGNTKFLSPSLSPATHLAGEAHTVTLILNSQLVRAVGAKHFYTRPPVPPPWPLEP